jgi:hypothetical protein
MQFIIPAGKEAIPAQAPGPLFCSFPQTKKAPQHVTGSFSKTWQSSAAARQFLEIQEIPRKSTAVDDFLRPPHRQIDVSS